MEEKNVFKRCSCQAAWATREEFILDPDILAIGLSPLPDMNDSRAFYYFNHATCKTTLVLDSEEFADLIEEPIPADIKLGEKECEGHCTKKEDLKLCSADCRNAPFRRFFVNSILNRKL